MTVMYLAVFLIVGVSLPAYGNSEEADEPKIANEKVVKARLETLGGCRLNGLPEVKTFIEEHAPKYYGVDVEYLTGRNLGFGADGGPPDPELVLLTTGDEIVNRVNLVKMSCEEIIHLLATYNIHEGEEVLEKNKRKVYDKLQEDRERLASRSRPSEEL